MGQFNPIPNLIRQTVLQRLSVLCFSFLEYPSHVKNRLNDEFGEEMKMGPGYRGARIAAHEKRLEQFRQTWKILRRK